MGALSKHSFHVESVSDGAFGSKRSDARNVAISQARASYWSHLAEEAAEGCVPVLSLRSALPAAPKAARAGRPAPALTLGLFDEDEE